MNSIERVIPKTGYTPDDKYYSDDCSACLADSQGEFLVDDHYFCFECAAKRLAEDPLMMASLLLCNMEGTVYGK